MLCMPVFIFTFGSSVLLGHPHCDLSIWLSLLAIFKTIFWVFLFFLSFFKWENGQNTKILKGLGRWQLSSVQSISIEKTSVSVFVRGRGTKNIHLRYPHPNKWAPKTKHFASVIISCLSLACKKEEDQARDKDSGKLAGRTQYHKSPGCCQGPCGNWGLTVPNSFNLYTHKLLVFVV